MRPRPAAMAQDVVAVAASLLKSISEDGESVEGTVLVNALGEGGDGGCEPGGVSGDGVEMVAKDVSKEVWRDIFLSLNVIQHMLS